MTENETFRLTTDKKVTEMGMYELAHNCCYIKDGLARYRDFEMDVDARDFVREIGKEISLFETGCAELIDDESFDATMIDWLQYSHTNVYGLLALIYRNLWAMAELREHLKGFEEIGTIEEFKALKEKNNEHYSDTDELDGYGYTCTNKTCVERIRNKAIDEFAELMKEKLKDMQFAEFQGIDVCPCAKTGEECPYINQDIGCQYCAREQTIKEIDEIAEQMKAGGKNES